MIDPRNPDNVYVAELLEGVFRSSDAGSTWAPANTGIPAGSVINCLAIDPTSSAVLYAGIDDGTSGAAGGLYVSSDAGDTWQVASPQLPRPIPRRLALEPPTGTAMSAVDPSGSLLTSLDGGTLWQLKLDQKRLTDVAFVPGRPA